MNIVNREHEIEELNRLRNSDKSVLGCLYGRRRVGKTHLLDELWSDPRTFYFLAGNTTSKQNRRELIAELNSISNIQLHVEDYGSWRDFFRLLVEISSREPMTVVLDEVQYLMEKGNQEEFTSQLNAVWEREVGDVNLSLFLCGSEISVMSHLNDADAPLHGRFDFFGRLSPFDYYDAARMMGKRTFEEYITTYAIYGGMPGYLDFIPPDIPLKKHVCRNILSRSGPVGNQLDGLFKMEEGIREPRKYRAVLTAVAQGNTRINDIGQVSGVTGRDNQSTRRKLETMMELFLVRRERNIETDKGHYRYYVADPAVKFWYRFVHENRHRLDKGETGDVWDQYIEPRLNDYVGPIFEHLCKDAYFRFAPDWGLTRPAEWTRWVGTARSGDSVEIDIVSKLDDDHILTGEVKWSSSPVGDRIHSDHVNKLKKLRESGIKWAHRALDTASGESAGYIYFSSAGFTAEFRKRSKSDDHITLITIDDLFD